MQQSVLGIVQACLPDFIYGQTRSNADVVKRPYEYRAVINESRHQPGRFFIYAFIFFFFFLEYS
jgi:hypothetical protein